MVRRPDDTTRERFEAQRIKDLRRQAEQNRRDAEATERKASREQGDERAAGLRLAEQLRAGADTFEAQADAAEAAQAKGAASPDDVSAVAD